MDLGNPTDLNFSGQITLDAWIKPESTGGLQDIIAHGYQTSPTNAEDFLRIDGGYYQVGSWNGSDAVAQVAIPAGDIGQWVNLVGVYNGTQWILYRDGVQVATSGATSQGALPVSNDRLGDWCRGQRHRAVLPGGDRRRQYLERRPLGGRRRVRSCSRPRPHPNPGLVAYYPFNETSGDTAIDATGHGNNGTLGGISPNNPAAEPSRVTGSVSARA